MTAGIAPLRPLMSVPRWFHKGVVLGLGVLIGAFFVPGMVDRLASYPVTVTGVLLTTVAATAIGVLFLTRVRGYDRQLALLCSIPGGQAELLAIARETVERDYVVALCHLLRVALIFCSVPLVLALAEGRDAVAESNRVLRAMPSLFDLPPAVLLQFVGLAVGGFGLARLVRLPIPHLLGPMLASLVCHLAGWIALPRIYEFVFLAQVTIGGAVGARLGQVRVGELRRYFVDALMNLAIIIAVFGLGVTVILQLVTVDPVDLVLAFVPGGLYEVTMLSLVFGFDVAFVASHNLARILLVLGSIPFLPLGAARADAGDRPR